MIQGPVTGTLQGEGMDPSTLGNLFDGNGLLIAGIVIGIVVILVIVKIVFSLLRKVLAVVVTLALTGAIGGGFIGIATGALDKVPGFLNAVFDIMPWS